MKLHFTKNDFSYGCSSAEEYMLVKEMRDQFNHRVWQIVSGIFSVYFAALFISTFSLDVVAPNAIVYAVMAVISFSAFLLLNTVVRPNSLYLRPVIYSVCIALFLFGILIGVILSPEYLAVTFHVMLIGLPLILADRPYRMGALQLLMTLVFMLSCVIFKEGDTCSLDIYNAVTISLLGQFINYYMVHSRIAQMLAAKRLEIAGYTDDLTQLFNRNACEKDMLALSQEDAADCTYVVLDLNGLKVTNDRYGHLAGDELLKDAAQCIREQLGSYGKLYRVGGDEFVALLHVDPETCCALSRKLEEAAANWQTTHGKHLSFAVGCASVREHPGLPLVEVAKIADQRMYEQKAAYYRAAGIERRGRPL